MKKCASVYLRDRKLFISSSSRTTEGIWIDTGPVHVVEADDVNQIAKAARLALENSKHGISAPPPGEELTGAVLEAASTKSWRTFVSRATMLDVCVSDGLATVTPYRKFSARGNYEPQTEKSRTCRVGSAEFGTTILSTFDDAN